MSFNTISYTLTQEYLRTSFDLDIKGFGKLLSKDVELTHTTNNEQLFKISGYDKVMKKFEEIFFSNTKDFNIKSLNINSNELKPIFSVSVDETKKEGNRTYRAAFYHIGSLEIIKEGSEYKIRKISNIVFKHPIDEEKSA